MLGKGWRFINTGPLPGPENMAIDEALLRCFTPETSTPVLRLYGWSPPALSLGRFQDLAKVLDLERCQIDGLPIVRRVTGGGVIYHAEELTYSIVCAPHHLPQAATIKESFRILTGYLLAFYRSFGLTPAYAADVHCKDAGLGERTSYCFAGKESFDILIDGRKIGGNAQRRLKSVIFQHGSIPLKDRSAIGADFMREPPTGIGCAVTSLAQQGITIEADLLGKRLAECFAETFLITLTPSGLSTVEREVAAAFVAGKYASDAWNLRGEEQ